MKVARPVAFTAGFAGVTTGFWHITPVGGAVFLVAAMVATGVQSAGYVRVERDDAAAAPDGEAQRTTD